MITKVMNMTTMTIASLNAMVAAKDSSVTLDGTKFSITSIEQAVKLFKDYRDAEGDWECEEPHGISTMRKTDGYITIGRKVVARISYNGRVWEGKEYVVGAEPLN